MMKPVLCSSCDGVPLKFKKKTRRYSIRTEKCAAIKNAPLFKLSPRLFQLTHIFHLSLININVSITVLKIMLCDFAQIILWDFLAKGEKKVYSLMKNSILDTRVIFFQGYFVHRIDAYACFGHVLLLVFCSWSTVNPLKNRFRQGIWRKIA